jgi:hypothetical protein
MNNAKFKLAALKLLLIMVAFLCAAPLGATTLTFAVDPAQTGIVYTAGLYPTDTFTFHSSQMNGTKLNGQSLSVDAIFGGDVLARVFALYPQRLGVGLMLFTDAPGVPGQFGNATGNLLSPQGQASNTLVAGRAMSDAGQAFMCLVLFNQSDLGGYPVIDISGAHFDTTLPTSGYSVTDAMLVFVFTNNRVEFGTAAQLPEPPTWVTMGIGLAILGVLVLRDGKKKRLP